MNSLEAIPYLEYQLQLKLEGHNQQWLQLVQQCIQNTASLYLYQNRNDYIHEFGCGVSILGLQIRQIFCLIVTRFKGNFQCEVNQNSGKTQIFEFLLNFISLRIGNSNCRNHHNLKQMQILLTIHTNQGHFDLMLINFVVSRNI